MIMVVLSRTLLLLVLLEFEAEGGCGDFGRFGR